MVVTERGLAREAAEGRGVGGRERSAATCSRPVPLGRRGRQRTPADDASTQSTMHSSGLVSRGRGGRGDVDVRCHPATRAPPCDQPLPPPAACSSVPGQLVPACWKDDRRLRSALARSDPLDLRAQPARSAPSPVAPAPKAALPKAPRLLEPAPTDPQRIVGPTLAARSEPSFFASGARWEATTSVRLATPASGSHLSSQRRR